jgi:hypothetical protein
MPKPKQHTADAKKSEKGAPSPTQSVLSFTDPKKGLAKITKHLNSFALGAAQEGLELEFCLTLFPIGGSIFYTCLELYKGNVLNAAQCKELLGISNNITSLAFNILTGKKDLKQGLTDFVGILKELESFCRNNTPAAVKLGATVLASMHPLGIFIKVAVDKLLKSDMPRSEKSVFTHLFNTLSDTFGKLAKYLGKTAEHTAKSPKPT